MILKTIATSVAQYQKYLEDAFESEDVEYVSVIGNLVVQYAGALLQKHADTIGIKEVSLVPKTKEGTVA
jgi:hypothetical protein